MDWVSDALNVGLTSSNACTQLMWWLGKKNIQEHKTWHGVPRGRA